MTASDSELTGVPKARHTSPTVMPGLVTLYGRALGDAVKSAISSQGTLAALPHAPITIEHPGVAQHKVDAFADVMGAAAFDGVHRAILPSVLVHSVGFGVQMTLMTAKSFPLQLVGLVHLHNSVEYFAPILPGEPLTVTAYAQNMAAHRRGTQVEIVVEVSAQGDQRISWRGVSTYLSKGVFLAGRDTDSASEGEAEKRSSPQSFEPPMKTGLWRLGKDAGRVYAGISGDYNPIHISSVTAKVLGMPSAIAHGMYAAAYMLSGREPEGAGHRWEIRFEAPMTLPATVAYSITPASSAATQKDSRASELDFVGWNPRKMRRHFYGAIHLPAA